MGSGERRSSGGGSSVGGSTGRLAEDTLAYTVKSSDTLTSLAARFDTTPSELVAINKLSSRLIFPGQVTRALSATRRCPAGLRLSPRLSTLAGRDPGGRNPSQLPGVSDAPFPPIPVDKLAGNRFIDPFYFPGSRHRARTYARLPPADAISCDSFLVSLTPSIFNESPRDDCSSWHLTITRPLFRTR